MLVTKTLLLLLLITICVAIVWRVFTLYLETVLRYEKEEDPEKEEILNRTLKNLRFRLRCMVIVLIIVMASTPIILIKSFQ